MEVDGDELSAEEQRLALELTQLVPDPSPERHAAIMAAVRSLPIPRAQVLGGWRLALAGVAAMAIVLGSAVGAVASSGDALPDSPRYSLRVFGEQVRLALAAPTTREQLRIDFAHARVSQAQAVLGHGDRSNARGLLRDSRDYIAQTKKDLANVPAGEQGQISAQLNQTEADEHQAENQLNQGGEQGQSGG